MADIKKGFMGSLLLVMQSFADKAVGMVSTLILARLLTPEDFGIVAIATLVVGFLDSFTTTGFQQYLVVKDEVKKSDLNTAWTINILLKFSVALLLILAAPWVSAYFNEQRLSPILWLAAFNIILATIWNPGTVMFTRNQEYLPRVKLIVTAKVISAIFTIACAYIYQSYWVLIIGQTVGIFIKVVGSYIIHPHRPKFQLVNYKDQLKFSGWLMPQSLLGYGKTQIDTLMVAARFGAEVLGGYHIVKYLALIASSHILQPMTEPLLRQLASIKENKRYFAMQSNVCVIVSVLLSAPIVIIMMNNHSELTLFFLGEQWLDYSTLLAVFAVSVFSHSLSMQVVRLIYIQQDTRKIFFYDLLNFTATVAVLLGWEYEEFFDLAVARTAVEFILTLSFLTITVVSVTGRTNFYNLLKGLIPAVVAYIAGFAAIFYFSVAIDLLPTLMINTALVLIVVLLSASSLYFLWFKRYAEWRYLMNVCNRLVQCVTKKLGLKQRFNGGD